MLAWCSILHSLKFDMQHDHVLKKVNFDLLTPSPGSEGGGRGLQVKYLLLCCCICVSLKFDMPVTIF